MPQKDFRADLAEAIARGQRGRLGDIKRGEDDGSISFAYTLPSSSQAINIQATVSDTSEYPRYHTYFVYSTTDSTPEAISTFLESSQHLFTGLRMQELLESICEKIDAVSLGREYVVDVLNDYAATPSMDEMDWDDDANEDSSAENMDWDDDEDLSVPAQVSTTAVEEMRRDLRLAKAAGYRVGYLGDVTGAVLVSLSCRIEKMGISQEAMQAWNVRPKDFLVLLIRYPHGYQRLDRILSTKRDTEMMVQMHVGLCDSYKPCLGSAMEVFIHNQTQCNSDTNLTTSLPLRPVFIGKSLNQLLNDRLISLVRYRLQHGFSWTGAEHFFNDGQGRVAHSSIADQPPYTTLENWDRSTPAFLVADHISQDSNSSRLSFPLLAVQYSLRRFVKCTEFCLNCYCKLDAEFDAIKPYVCSKGLCLFQYMELGMGPSIEWEIHSQPYVVDMLISFAYARAQSHQLADFPSGLGVKVPRIFDKEASIGTHTAVLDETGGKLHLHTPLNMKVGNWLLLGGLDADMKSMTSPRLHYRVQGITNNSLVQLSDPIRIAPPSGQEQTSQIGKSVQFMVYDMDFDRLDDRNKNEAIMMLLDTLPDLDAMASFMESGPNASYLRPLKSWVERISPSALYVLRWIVASNRSCIMYDDDPKHQVSGMKDYLQFRLAQGAPDKEQRFVNSVNGTKGASLRYPTLFAWHGSPLQNWHSILREGLNFDKVANGRACGNGVYMSSQFGVSLGYATRSYVSYGGTSRSHTQWPHSKLNIQIAVSLNEVVNAPKRFTSSSSCYVVANLDWIQPRYLFIQCMDAGLKKKGEQDSPTQAYDQDPQHRAHGPAGNPVTIPISAVASHGGQTLPTTTNTKTHNSVPKFGKGKTTRGSTKRKKDTKQATAPLCSGGDDDTDSVVTLIEDREFLQGGDTVSEEAKMARAHQESLSKTDFRPGTLQESSVKLFGPPQYATSTATKVLQRRLQETLAVQEREPLHELGWYIDQNLINTVYQWTAELHSFDPALPLAKDLKAAGLTSIVLEIRFPPEFPISPPFVRVVRPRFRPFSLGGGGHVTGGGAMCMELLTSSGWTPASSIESVLLQVRMAISNTEPQPARLDSGRGRQEYSVGEAVEAYKRVCLAHGWRIPTDLQTISW